MKRHWYLAIGGTVFFLWKMFLETVNAAVRYPLRFGIFFTAAGSVFPDMPEPAQSGSHRGFFHGRGVLCLQSAVFLLTALGTVSPVSFPDQIPVYPASCFLAGYLCHLLADATIPRGIPR
jgi:hypothetical protein